MFLLGIETIDRVGVVGAGTMGSGIAQVAATHGYDVVIRDIEAELIEHGFDTIDASLARLDDRDTLADEPAAIRGRIEGTTTLDALTDCDLVVEAAVENLDVKQDIFTDLDGVMDTDAVLATNTSTLSITSISACMPPKRCSRNSASGTSQRTFSSGRSRQRNWGKRPERGSTNTTDHQLGRHGRRQNSLRQGSRDDLLLDFRGPLEDRGDLCIPVIPFDVKVFRVAIATVNLNSLVWDIDRRLAAKYFAIDAAIASTS